MQNIGLAEVRRLPWLVNAAHLLPAAISRLSGRMNGLLRNIENWPGGIDSRTSFAESCNDEP